MDDIHEVQRLRHLASTQIPTTHTGTIYDCSQEDLDLVLQFAYPSLELEVSPEEATRYLVRFNRPDKEPSPREQEAIHRLETMAEWSRDEEWDPDIVFKVFADIDIVFFDRFLLGNVELRWASGSEFAIASEDIAESWGHTQYNSQNRAQSVISLNADKILSATNYGQDSSFRHMWETTLHEMVVSPRSPVFLRP